MEEKAEQGGEKKEWNWRGVDTNAGGGVEKKTSKEEWGV